VKGLQPKIFSICHFSFTIYHCRRQPRAWSAAKQSSVEIGEEMRRSRQPLGRLGVIIVALHFVVVVVHSGAHINLHVDTNLWQSVYIFLVIVALPLLAGILLWRGRGGFLVLLFSMLGALIFGVYYHFITAGIDNACSLGFRPWSRTFQVTAVLLALTEAAGVLTGVVGMLKKSSSHASA
jgi:hypothetical protein